MPYLHFENLNHGPHISKFISNVLSHRNNQIQLSSVSLVLGRTVKDDESVRRILNCAFAHNVQQLTVTRSPGKIVGCPLSYRSSFIATPTWDLPALTTLHLHHIQLSDDHDSTGKCIGFFSKFTNLKNLSMELIPHEACVFANTKISRFITKMPVKVYLEVRALEKVTMSTEIKNYENSPSVIFPMVSHEEIEAMGDMAAAHVFVKHLGLLLKQCKANTNSKPQVKKHWESELQLNLAEMIALIKQSKFVASEICLMWEQCMSSRRGTIEIIAWLQEILSSFQCIKGWMTRLSASKRAVLQPNYSTLCEDAAIVTNNILGWMKTIKETQEMNALII